jgi:hypothetical protein
VDHAHLVTAERPRSAAVQRPAGPRGQHHREGPNPAPVAA